MYGAIIGDIVGSKFEFDRGNKTKEFPLFARQDQFTDDTVMTCAVAEALLNAGINAGEDTLKRQLILSMKKWGKRYPDAGYGYRFSDWVLYDDSKPYYSFGNGSAMRVSPVGWIYNNPWRTQEVARWTAEITHNHPKGIKGAEATATAIFMARSGYSKEQISDMMKTMFEYDVTRPLSEIRPTYRHVEDCMHTVPEAIRCFLEAQDYEDTLRNVAYIGGDTDTIGAIAGSIAEAFWGIPKEIVDQANAYLTKDILKIIKKFRKVRLSPAPRNNA